MQKRFDWYGNAEFFIKMKFLPAFSVVVLFVLMVSCGPEQEIKVYSYSFAFADSTSGWAAGFADYEVVDSAAYLLGFKHDTLPYNINPDASRYSLKLSGTNVDGNGLFMFIKRRVTGLKPNTVYQALLNIRLASKEALNTNEIDDTPGELVYLKAGASTIEPQALLSDAYYRININKGEGMESGLNMTSLGNIAVSATTTRYTIITRFNTRSTSVPVTTDDQGGLWLLVGTDSRYAGRTTVYYTQIDAFLNQVD